ncbi:MAG: hypothetical protein PSV13_17735 [Lacunisphaera sp.]|nr:hypothetical protein [Lacunisphaera sp.]
MKPWRYKLALMAALLGVYVALAIFPGIMRSFGVGVSVLWFRDTHSMLAASDSAREGRDPFVDNVHDVAGERHIYPDWWFLLGRLGLSRADSFWLGGLVVGLFWLAVLAVLRLRSRRDVGWALLVCASPPFWLAVNRANPDLLVCALLTPVVPWLLHRRRWVRMLAPGPVALAAGLKFFPVLAGAVFFYPAATRREEQIRWWLIAALGLLLAWSLADDVQRYLAAGWLARGLFTFGAASVPLHSGVDPEICVDLGRLAGAALFGWAVLRRSGANPAVTDEWERTRRYGVMGAAVLAGSFFLTVGYLYKVIFVVWLLPLLLAGPAPGGTVRAGTRFCLFCLVGMLWGEGLVCAVISQWPGLADAHGLVVLRRTAAIISGLLAWGFIVPVVAWLGAEIRSIRSLRASIP